MKHDMEAFYMDYSISMGLKIQRVGANNFLSSFIISAWLDLSGQERIIELNRKQDQKMYFGPGYTATKYFFYDSSFTLRINLFRTVVWSQGQFSHCLVLPLHLFSTILFQMFWCSLCENIYLRKTLQLQKWFCFVFLTLSNQSCMVNQHIFGNHGLRVNHALGTAVWECLSLTVACKS